MTSTVTSTPKASFVSKPARGWLHPDHLFAKDGINYNVRYMGCIDVNTSMKILDFETRSAIAKECINRVCDASSPSGAGDVSTKSRRKSESRIARMLGEKPSLDKAGANVQLTITSLWLKLSDLDSGNAIFIHDMPNISFASGGDTDSLDFVAYVAKDSNRGRSCFVLECKGGLAQDVITTIGQAFELRFKEFLKRSPTSKPPPLQMAVPAPRNSLNNHNDDVEYYNDLPGKTPPEFSPVHKLRPTRGQDGCNSNLIDFHTEISTTRMSDPDYVNGDVPNPRQKSHRDPFDMSPFATSAPDGGIVGHSNETKKMQLSKEDWFHGPISRADAEVLLLQDGDFLVRESQDCLGQYVLTGMQNNSRKHLLLVDPEGVVRTKDRTFDSVSHLINFHHGNGLPIITTESALRLRNPIVKTIRKI